MVRYFGKIDNGCSLKKQRISDTKVAALKLWCPNPFLYISISYIELCSKSLRKSLLEVVIDTDIKICIL